MTSASLTSAQYSALNHLLVGEDSTVSLGDVARNVLGMQAQYASYYVDGVGGCPVLTDDLRVDVSGGSYHSYRIHVEDAPLFVVRVLAHRNALVVD